MDTEHVIKAMERFCSEHDMKLTTLGQMSVSNRHAYARLKNGTAQISTGRDVLAWISEREAMGGTVPRQGGSQ